MTEAFEVFVPGAFETFFSGTGVVAGDPYSQDPAMERGAKELREAWQGRTTFKRGRGRVYGLRLTSVEAAVVLAEYAEVCLMLNSQQHGENDHSEKTAARKVLERIGDATGGRVIYDGWNINLDGRRVA
jgi:hypothetical protein